LIGIDLYLGGNAAPFDARACAIGDNHRHRAVTFATSPAIHCQKI